MKKLLFVAVAIFIFFGCKENEVKELHVYTWAEYIAPEVVADFEKSHGVKVVIDTYDSNETLYAKLKAGAVGYDVLFPSSYMAKLLGEQGMLEPLNKTSIPNLKHLDESYFQFLLDRDFKFSVPYMLSTSGIGYLKSKVGALKNSWAVLGDETFSGRMTMLNDMRESFGAALKFLGYSLNTRDWTEIVKAKEVLIGWKKNLAKFESEQYKNGLASGEFFVVHGYSGDVLQAKSDSEDVEYMIPAEGTSVAIDELVIAKGAREKELAHAFINFLHEPKNASRNMEYVQYLCPNKAAYELLSREVREDTLIFPTKEALLKAEVIEDLGEDNKKYTAAWEEVKQAG